MPKLESLEKSGRCWFRSALSQDEVLSLRKLTEASSSYGERIWWIPSGADTHIALEKISEIVRSFLPSSIPVRILSFSKSSTQNWSLPWHQDRVIAVDEKVEISGFTNWTKKAGVWHCEPPIEFLDSMIIARVYLTDTTRQNGAMQIALGSHKYGKIPASQIEDLVSGLQVEDCVAKRGDVLLLKALILHKSGQSLQNTSRDALRIDYSNANLPSSLNWAISVI